MTLVIIKPRIWRQRVPGGGTAGGAAVELHPGRPASSILRRRRRHGLHRGPVAAAAAAGRAVHLRRPSAQIAATDAFVSSVVCCALVGLYQ